MNRVLLMAGGEQKRFPETSPPKQLLHVAGEPILKRTVRQLRSRGIEDIVLVAKDPKLVSVADQLGLRLFPSSGSSTLEGVLATRSLWRGRTLVVLADVIFSDRCMDRIAGSCDELRFFGRFNSNPITKKPYGEIFAVVFEADRVSSRLVESLEYIVVLPPKATHRGRKILWELYRHLSGYPLLVHKKGPLFYDVEEKLGEDFTEDIDTEEEAKTIIPLVERELKVFHESPLLIHCLSLIKERRGTVMEFGVGRGHSFRIILDCLDPGLHRVIGFDGWEGLPAEAQKVWRPRRFKEGSYKYSRKETMEYLSSRIGKGMLWSDRVTFVDRRFSDLGTDLYSKLPVENLIFVNIDVDLYVSAREVLRWLTPILQEGIIISFDEWRHDDCPADQAMGEQLAVKEFNDASNGWRIRMDPKTWRKTSSWWRTTQRFGIVEKDTCE